MTQLCVKHEERSPIKQQMIPGNVDEWMGDYSPPFAMCHALRHEDESPAPGATRERQIRNSQEDCKEQEFESVAHGEL